VKYPRIIQSVYFEPWSITAEGWQSVHQILKPRILGDAAQLLQLPKAESEEHDFFGNELPKMEIIDGVAIIPIIGTLMPHATLLDRQCGACSYDDIKRNVRAALNTSDIRKIVFHCDSPGGMCMGMPECARVIDDATDFVETEAVTDGLMCSACYDLIAGVNRIKCTPSARVGSIGAMGAWLDQSVRYEMAGLKVELFKSGPLKGTGEPGLSLTEAQRDYLQSGVDKFAGMFFEHVRASRLISDEKTVFSGRTWIGSDAVEVGLVDEVTDEIECSFEHSMDSDE
jgi:ClpP class serine protease